jgi:hypothetical protein
MVKWSVEKKVCQWDEWLRIGSMTVFDQLSNYQLFTKDFL